MPTQILVPLHTYPDGNSPNVARHVAQTARHLAAAVHGLLLSADFPPIGNPLGNLILDADALVRAAKSKSHENGQGLLRTFSAEMKRAGVDFRSTEIEYFPTELADKVSDLARYHDLTVLGVGSHDAALRGTAEEVIFAAGRPILLVPEDLDVTEYGSVAIAWDGSRVAARAVGDAMSFLGKATAATILCVTDEKALPNRDVGIRLAEYLGQHEIKAGVENLVTGDLTIAETLQTHALGIGAGLLVMGGFGHSRLREFVLGGATAGILRDLCMPVLISH
jgi:nucleotide-binding universal stress UspA family protein